MQGDHQLGGLAAAPLSPPPSPSVAIPIQQPRRTTPPGGGAPRMRNSVEGLNQVALPSLLSLPSHTGAAIVVPLTIEAKIPTALWHTSAEQHVPPTGLVRVLMKELIMG